MKNLFLLVAVIFLTVFTGRAQIGDCTQNGTQIRVYDVNGNYRTTLIIGSGATLAGFSSSIIVVTQPARVRIYGPDGGYKTEFIISRSEWVKTVSGNNILITDGRLIKTYDSTGQFLNQRLE